MAAEKLVIGLGNPGHEYEKTRHNLGFLVVLRLAQTCGADFKKSRQANALVAEISDADLKSSFVLPLTYMNNSGNAVRDIAHFKKIAPQDILVVCDDINLDFGEMRLKQEGSDGGHNGLKSLIAELGGGMFPRLKIGIGTPPSREQQADYVLAGFNSREVKELPGIVDQAVECCRLWISGDVSRAMTEFNKRKDRKDNE